MDSYPPTTMTLGYTIIPVSFVNSEYLINREGNRANGVRERDAATGSKLVLQFAVPVLG